jgi:transcriptional regulator with XRE-family HTH domain
MKLSKAIAKRVRELRDVTGLSQQEIAQRGDLSVSLVAKLEQGKKADPRASTLLALAQAFSVKPGRLLDDLFPPSSKEPKPSQVTDAEEEQKEAEKASEEPALDGSAVEGEDEGKKEKKKKGKKKHKAEAKND